MAVVKSIFKSELIDELRNVATYIKKESNLEKKIYYFSAAYGITERTFRYSFSSDILVADCVLHIAYNSLNQRMKMMKSGDTTVLLDEAIFNGISEGLLQLADAIEKNKPIQKALESIMTASYCATGNGNYLREKGLIQI